MHYVEYTYTFVVFGIYFFVSFGLASNISIKKNTNTKTKEHALRKMLQSDC